jgi:arsenite-transporting ATPase
MAEMPIFALLNLPTRFLFFTGKGGVGKTSLSCAVAIALADAGKRVLLVSTDPASNLDEMLEAKLSDIPWPVTGVANLFALNIDPETAADAYRSRVLAQLPSGTSAQERQGVVEQLSGACTTEIAAFDEFAGLLAGDAAAYDHVVFDTAPTGHTLRLLSLPKAWSGFLEGNDRGASCLGPHSGLKMQEHRFNDALDALSNPIQTTVVLVTRPEPSAIREAARTSGELRELGLSNQLLAINGVFTATDREDAVALTLERGGARAILEMPEELAALPSMRIALRAFDMVGLPALRALLQPGECEKPDGGEAGNLSPLDLPGLPALVDELSGRGKGLIMVMGKGGVGKTTVAAAIAVGLVKRGHAVHLSTTDPAAHVATTVEGGMEGLRVDRIDPKAETQNYIDKIMATRGAYLDEQARALLLEDLQSPCTEEVAVFHAFSKTVAEARAAYVVLDTAPTGHTLLLMDATGAYHRQMVRDVSASGSPARAVTPLMRLQDPAYTQIILVTLPETTPVSEAAALQDDLRRADIDPYAWVINRSLAAAGTSDPLLVKRIERERVQIDRVRSGLARRLFLIGLQESWPVGLAALERLTTQSS